MTAGEATPIVLLPGLDGDGRLLDGLKRRLAPRPASIIAYPPDRPLGYADLVRFAAERLPAEPCILLGESFSGPIAIELAASAPSRIRGLILAASFARRPAPAGGLLARAWLASGARPPLWAIAAALMGRWSTLEIRRDLGEALASVRTDVLACRAAELARVDKLSRLAAITCPLLYMRGRRDRLIGMAAYRQIHRTAPAAELCEIDGPHMFLATHAEASAATIEAFCGRIEASQST